MSKYPDVLFGDTLPVIPFNYSYDQRILKTEFENGTESRRLIWTSPRRGVSLQYKALPLEDAQTIYEFYLNQDGPYRRFVFYFPQEQTYTREFCGTNRISGHYSINLPSIIKYGTNYNLYKGNTYIPPSEYQFYEGAGPDSEDVLTMDYTPLEVGASYYFSFYGRLKLRARFADNPVEVEEVKGHFASFAINLLGLSPEII